MYASTLLVLCQEEQLACKKLSDKVLTWLCLEQGVIDASAAITSLASLKMQNSLSFCCQLNPIVLEKGH